VAFPTGARVSGLAVMEKEEGQERQTHHFPQARVTKVARTSRHTLLSGCPYLPFGYYEN
jgi:hypothetical protein